MHHDDHRRRPRAPRRLAALTSALSVVLCACASDGSTDVRSTAMVLEVASTPDDTTAPGLARTEATVPSDEPAPTGAQPGGGWDAALTARCGHIWEGVTSFSFGESVAGIERWASAWQEHLAAAPAVDEAAFPAPALGDLGGYDDTMRAAQRALAAAVEAGADDDLGGARLAAEQADDLLLQSQLMLAVAGAPCFNKPARITGATINVPLLGAWQVGAGFGSLWVSKQFSDAVARVDPESGRVLATIQVGSTPIKLQPADGRLWVRTSDAYVAIDPTTNTIATTLNKGAVGPDANRSWAVDGSLWICDGTRLHRYDPLSVTFVTTIELDIHCGQVTATPDLAVAWTYNEDEGESGTSAAAFIDPVTNSVLALIDLPVDVNVPVISQATVFFPGALNAGAVTVERGSWAVSEHDLDVALGGSQPTTDGTFIYVATADRIDIAVVDPRSHRVVGTIEPLEANSLVATGDGLWVVNNVFGYLQRFDLPT